MMRTPENDLYDVRASSPEWLAFALEAAAENIRLQGSAYDWFRHGRIDLTHFLRTALNCKQRHEQSNYDRLRDAGLSREQALRLAEFQRGVWG